jgi:peptidoglycan/xylan/chitin deacetylase (PgdA/CDA1 family)
MTAWLPVLTFHAVDERRSVISIPPRVFRQGLAALHERGFRTLGLSEAAERVRGGSSFPERAFAITFDDGYESVYQEAFPVLQRLGMSATVFLTAGVVGAGRASGGPGFEGRPMLSWPEVREMQRQGLTIGAHTLTHPDLTTLPSGRVETEVRDSKLMIEDAVGVSVACFAYPYGRYDRRVRDIVRGHFTCACSDRLGLVDADSDPFALERVDAYYLRSERLFAVMLSRLFPYYVRARGVPRRIRRLLRRGPAGPGGCPVTPG